MSVEKFNVISCFHYDKCLERIRYIYRNIFAKYSIGNRFNRHESVTKF